MLNPPWRTLSHDINKNGAAESFKTNLKGFPKITFKKQLPEVFCKKNCSLLSFNCIEYVTFNSFLEIPFTLVSWNLIVRIKEDLQDM